MYSWARSSYSFEKKLKSIEKKLIIVKNREDLNSTIHCDLMSEENFLLNDKVCDYSQTWLYRTFRGNRNCFDISRVQRSRGLLYPKSLLRQIKSKGNEKPFNIAAVRYIMCSL